MMGSHRSRLALMSPVMTRTMTRNDDESPQPIDSNDCWNDSLNDSSTAVD